MGDVPVPGYQTYWTNKGSTLKSEYQTLVQQYQDADTQLNPLSKVMGDIEDMAGHTPASVGESAEWAVFVNSEEENCWKALHGDTF
jgi:chaperonin cofactor prefoldin